MTTIDEKALLEAVLSSTERSLESARNTLQSRINSFVMIISFMAMTEATIIGVLFSDFFSIQESGDLNCLNYLSIIFVISCIVLIAVIAYQIGIFYRKFNIVYNVPNCDNLPFLPKNVGMDVDIPNCIVDSFSVTEDYDPVGHYRMLVYESTQSLNDQLKKVLEITNIFKQCGRICIASVVCLLAAVIFRLLSAIDITQIAMHPLIKMGVLVMHVL